MATLQLTTIDEAFAAIQQIQALPPEAEVPEVEFGGELKTLSLHFTGDSYHSSLPSGTVRGLWEYQQSLYRGVAGLIYGTDDIRKLSNDQLRQFELVFDVREGSTGLEALLETFVEGLVEGLSTMDSKDKRNAVIGAVLIVVLGWGAAEIVSSWEETKRAQIAATRDVQMEEQRTDRNAATEAARTAQMKLFSDYVSGDEGLRQFSRHNRDGSHSVLKYATDASQIQIGKVSYEDAEIQEVKQRSPRGAPVSVVESALFRIVKLEALTGAGMQRVTVSSSGTGEITTLLEESSFTDEQIASVIQAYADRSKIHLDISIVTVNGSPRSTSIVQIGDSAD